MECKDLIGKKYKKLESLGKGNYGEVFKVEEIETKKIYAAKIFFNDDSDENENEIEMLQKFQGQNNQHIVNLIDSLEVYFPVNKKYLILEFCKNRELTKYIQFGKGLNPLYAKLLFKKILIAVKSIHKNGICHRDLKPDNILLDDNYNPKIGDFGFSREKWKKNANPSGSPHFASLEIFKYNYNGIEVDIFALGIILFNLLTGDFPFKCVIEFNKYIENKCKFEKKMINPLYKLIIRKNYKDFWKKVPLSKDEDFQKLFVKMIHYNLYKRPNIDEILKDPFLEEINNKSEKEIKDLEIEMKGEFDKIREQIKEINTTENVNNKNNKNEDKSSNRGYSEDEKYFDIDSKPEEFKKGIYLEYYIKIKGDISPYNYMNSLVNEIKNKNIIKGCDCEINDDINSKILEFELIIKENIKEQFNEKYDENLEEELKKLDEIFSKGEKVKEEEEEEEEDDDDDKINNFKIKDRDLVIQIKLFKSDENEYLLRFMKISGEKADFYKNLDYLYSLAKKKLYYL